VCTIDFKKRGWNGKNAFELEGFAFSASSPKEKQGRIWGKWIESLSIQVKNSNGTWAPEE
jgi:hypothetical protein